MRLSKQEQLAIAKAVQKFVTADVAKLYIFGSRTNDLLKGGDIDLVLIVEDLDILAKLKKIDYKIVAAIKSDPMIGDQKIDFSIIHQDEKNSPFYIEALKTFQEIPLDWQ